MTQAVDPLERWKSITSIASAIAIPFVLAIVGYFIQKQLADDGLKKDYVSIAAGILKENPEDQEPDLRKWAVEVLDKNSPIPFTKKAKLGLEHGTPLVLPGPFLFPPPKECMITSPERTVGKALKALEIDTQVVKKNETNNTVTIFLDPVLSFIDTVAEQEADAEITRIRLNCMQSWAKLVIEADEDWRKTIGAPNRASAYEEIQKRTKEKNSLDHGDADSSRGQQLPVGDKQ